jgi:hypothetical protein
MQARAAAGTAIFGSFNYWGKLLFLYIHCFTLCGLFAGLVAPAAGAGLLEYLFASGPFGSQFLGGKETRQNRGHGGTNSTPTSAVVIGNELISTTVQAISSSVTIFFNFSVCPMRTFSRNKINPPCAFTTSVAVRSLNALSAVFFPVTSSGIDNTILWLRRWLKYNVVRMIGVPIEKSSPSIDFRHACRVPTRRLEIILRPLLEVMRMV